jgi:hypothetical protein
VLGLERESFAEAQSEGVDSGERHAPHGVTNGTKDGAHFGATEDDRQTARLVDAEQLEDLGAATERVLEKEPKRADGDVDARRSLLLVVAEIEEVATDVLVRERFGLPADALEEQARGEQIGLLCPRAQVIQAQILAHPRAPVAQSDHRLFRGARDGTTPQRDPESVSVLRAASSTCVRRGRQKALSGPSLGAPRVALRDERGLVQLWFERRRGPRLRSGPRGLNPGR